MSNSLKNNALKDFQNFILQQKPALMREYTRAINRDLAKQNFNELMQRNVLLIMQTFYENVRNHLSSLNLDETISTTELKGEVINVFDEFLKAAIKHHRSSCALSNFPDEHNPSPEYIANIIVQENQLRDHFWQTESKL